MDTLTSQRTTEGKYQPCAELILLKQLCDPEYERKHTCQMYQGGGVFMNMNVGALISSAEQVLLYTSQE